MRSIHSLIPRLIIHRVALEGRTLRGVGGGEDTGRNLRQACNLIFNWLDLERMVGWKPLFLFLSLEVLCQTATT